MSSIQHLQNNKIKAIFWFIFFRQIAHYSGCRLQFDGKLIEAFEFWRNSIQIENALINFSREIAMAWVKTNSSFSFWSSRLKGVSVQGVKSLGVHFACLCRGLDFYEVKKIILLFFKKKREILLHF